MEGVDVTMFTVMSKRKKNTQLKQYNEVVNLPGIKVIITPHSCLNTLYTLVYLFVNVIKHGKVRLIAKKVNLKPLDLFKKVVGDRFKYTLELEGDAYSESEYLKNNPYKTGYYEQYLVAAAKNIENSTQKLKNADGILVLSHAFKKVLLERHDFLNQEKIKVISTGFIKGRFYFSSKTRDEYRKSLGLKDETVFIYAGNLYYSWQNIKKTLVLFLHYLKNVDNTAKFIILTQKEDQHIAYEFIDSLSVPLENVIIREVPNTEISAYYNVADICLLLRSDDIMNKVASPGKIGEYAASGTPILTSRYIGDYSELFKNQDLVKQVSDIKNIEEMTIIIQKLLKSKEEDKKNMSQWSNQKLSSENNVASFIEAFDI